MCISPSCQAPAEPHGPQPSRPRLHSIPPLPLTDPSRQTHKFLSSPDVSWFYLRVSTQPGWFITSTHPEKPGALSGKPSMYLQLDKGPENRGDCGEGKRPQHGAEEKWETDWEN